MAAFLSTSIPIKPHNYSSLLNPNYQSQFYRIRCNKQDSKKTTTSGANTSLKSRPETEPENVLLKVAWYSSELLGIAASVFRNPSTSNTNDQAVKRSVELYPDKTGALDRSVVVETIKDDFQRSYFVTGDLTLDVYEEDCEFADPAGSFKGLRRFKRNCTNFGLLIEKCNMKLMKWEDLEDKGIGHWRFSCVMSFPWKPILSATGYTEYYFDEQSGRVCRHVEHWNVPKLTLLKQLIKPSRRSSGFWRWSA